MNQQGTGKELRFVIIGCGRIAGRHADQIVTRGVLAGVCDVVKDKADTLANKYGTKAYASIDELLRGAKNIDVAAVCTPNGLHPEHTIACLEAGIHVLCEKPMAINSADCTRMMEAAERYGKLLAIVKQNRFNPPVVAVKKALDEGRLGKIFSVQLNCFWNRNADYYNDSSWRGSADMDGGTLFTQFSHFIDLLFWMFGEVEKAGSYMNNFMHQNIIEFEDTGVVILRFKSGALGSINYTVNSHGRNMEGSLTIFGEKGTVKIGGEYLNCLEYQNISDYCIDDLPAGNSANHYGNYVGSMSNHDKVYDNLIAAMQTGEALSTNAFDGLKTVQMIEQIYGVADRRVKD